MTLLVVVMLSFRVRFGEQWTELPTSTAATLSSIRKAFNSQSGHQVIPRNARAWLHWDVRWVEVIDDESFAAALADASYKPVKTKSTDSVVRHELWFQLHDSTTPPQVPSNAFADSSILIPDADFRLRLQFLVHDLLILPEDDRLSWDLLQAPTAQNASSIDDEHVLYAGLYLSSLYFTLDEQRWLAQFPTLEGVPFSDLVQRTMASKYSAISAAASSTGAHVCSSHDLAPLYRSVFGLHDAFYKVPAFKKAYARFEKQLRKQMSHTTRTCSTLVRVDKSLAIQSTATLSASAATSSASAATSSAPTASTATVVTTAMETPQHSKLRVLQAQWHSLQAQGNQPIDVKLLKQIQTLQKEVTRLNKKHQQVQHV